MDKKPIIVTLITILWIGLAGCQPGANSTASMPTSPITPSPQTELPIETHDQARQPIEFETIEIAYTKDNPATDNQEILSILDRLVTRFLAQFSKAGWFYFPNNGKDSYWLHIPEPGTDTYDQFLFIRQYSSYAAGFIWPFSIVLPDGSWGVSQISPGLDDYQFIKGGQQTEFPTVLANLDAFSGNVDGGVFGNTILMRYLHLVKNPEDDMDIGAEVSRTFSGWVEPYEGQDVFVLLTQETYSGMKPRLESTRKVIDREDIYTYFNLKNGGRIAEKYKIFLESGDSIEDGLRFNQDLVQYHESLPPEVQTLYDQAAEKLRIFLAGK